MKRPTDCLAGLRMIALADVDNLAISSLRIHHNAIHPGALKYFLGRRSVKLSAAAILTTKAGFTHTTEEWRGEGWNVTSVIRETVKTIRGEELLANADFDIAFEAGALVASHPHADGIILCTGDGNLATAIARDVKRRRPGMSVMAAAVPGSASSRLRDRTIFDGFIALGREVTRCA
ncbi:MAG: hypothetical protein CFE26_22030 [Verrucomicrobiales bacterium VVV1]|nr:MAG: hypothetical protein CFE26_22030 [Verrucomicrobiales bacterium VVV1]